MPLSSVEQLDFYGKCRRKIEGRLASSLALDPTSINWEVFGHLVLALDALDRMAERLK